MTLKTSWGRLTWKTKLMPGTQVTDLSLRKSFVLAKIQGIKCVLANN